jgi:hypothetical protein
MDDSNTSFLDVLDSTLKTAGSIATSFLSKGTGQQAVQPTPQAQPSKVPTWLWIAGGGVVVLILALVLFRK